MSATLFRIVWMMGAGGYPEPKYRREVKRTFDDAQGAANQLAVIDAKPRYHQLVRIERLTGEWQPVQREQLPPAKTWSAA